MSDVKKNKIRIFDSEPINRNELPSDFSRWCDYCTEKQAKRLSKAVESGLRQKTCAVCHIEFLTGSGLSNYAD